MLRKFLKVQKVPIRTFLIQIEPLPKAAPIKWKSVVGLEIHAQIASESKLFSGSGASFGAPLNNAVSFFDASIPGTLPVINKNCVHAGVKTALALGCRVNEVSMFDRKHYFYADLPNGYQITQQRAALGNDGELQFPVIVPGKKVYYKTVRLLQLQLEQDSGKSLHDESLKRSLVDLNRAGLPLMELVFAPDLENGEEAASLVKELMLILRRLKTCSCKMEEGALRVDANISIHLEGTPLGVRTEVKNIGSVRSISQAITYEINRQLEIVTEGGRIINETRSWDAEQRKTIAMRDKEVLQDYRFMPEPNLPPLRLNMLETENPELISVFEIAQKLPDLPEDSRQHLMLTFNLNQDTAIILVNEPVLLSYFENVVKHLPGIPTKLVTNFLLNELLTFCNKNKIEVHDCKLTYMHFKDLLKSLYSEDINLKSASQLLELLHQYPDKSIKQLIEEHNLQQISDPEQIEALCLQAFKTQEKALKQYQKGKQKALFAIVGEVAKLSDQKANMRAVVEMLEKLLKKK